MRKIISDRELLAYVNGRMTTAEMRELHKKAIQNGETDLLLHALLVNYESQKEYAAELLGIDDFEDKESETIVRIKPVSKKKLGLAADAVDKNKKS